MSTAELPPLPPGDDYSRTLSDLVGRVNGFVYPGERADAVIAAVRHLRADPELARALLGPEVTS